MFRVGDLVRLSARGKEKYRDEPYNPHNEVGVVEESHALIVYMAYEVRWSNFGNIYREVDLELALPSISLEEMLKGCLE
jgi:hypothetical protein